MKKIPKMSYLYPRLLKCFDECIYREQTASCSLTFPPCTRLVHATSSLWQLPTDFVSGSKMHKLYYATRDTTSCPLISQHAGCWRIQEEKRVLSFSFFFFSEISVQYSTHVTIVINGICKIKISGKNAEITNFHAVLLLSRLYLISYFRFRIRLCVVCARYGTRKLSTRFSSVLFTLTDRVHWFTDDEYLILLKVLILLRSILLFFFLF